MKIKCEIIILIFNKIEVIYYSFKTFTIAMLKLF